VAPVIDMIYAATPEEIEPVEERQDHERDRAAARGAQAAHQDADRAAVRRNRRHVVLGAARLGTDHDA
jgi:hypothetical protein